MRKLRRSVYNDNPPLPPFHSIERLLSYKELGRLIVLKPDREKNYKEVKELNYCDFIQSCTLSVSKTTCQFYGFKGKYMYPKL